MSSPAKPVEPALESLEEPVSSAQELAENEAAWEREVLWIAKEHAEGRAKSVPWEEVQAELFGAPRPGSRR